MKKYDRGWASLETGAALLIVMLLIAWGAGIWQDYIQTKGWQTEARLVSNWTSAARSYIGKNYTTLQGSSTTTTPAVITTTMLKNTGFLSSGFTETNSEGQRLQAYVVRNAQNPELLQAMVVSSGGTPYPVKALIQMAKDITTGLGGYIQDGKTATGALRSWSVALSNYGAKSGNGHIAVLLSTDELSGAAEDTDRLYRFQVNGRPDLNKMHTAIDMGSNNLNNVGAVNAQTGNFSGNVNGVNGTFSGQVKGNSGNFDVNVTAGGDIRSNNGWLITRNSKGWLNETHGGSNSGSTVITGRIANGQQIPLPTGFSASQCSWSVSNAENPQGWKPNYFAGSVATYDANRIVKCGFYDEYNFHKGTFRADLTGKCSYVVACQN
ncbi:shufflon system plasmid conjugative transfer pilus tip adhesin PilV [Escherichia coli]